MGKEGGYDRTKDQLKDFESDDAKYPDAIKAGIEISDAGQLEPDESRRCDSDPDEHDPPSGQKLIDPKNAAVVLSSSISSSLRRASTGRTVRLVG